eukprot:5007280-Pleurochrysis_carterae.AAC.2
MAHGCPDARAQSSRVHARVRCVRASLVPAGARARGVDKGAWRVHDRLSQRKLRGGGSVGAKARACARAARIHVARIRAAADGESAAQVLGVEVLAHGHARASTRRGRAFTQERG